VFMRTSMVSNSRNKCRWGLYYDGDRGFCDRVKQWLSGICFFDVIEWTPYQALERLPLGLAWDDLERAIDLDPARTVFTSGFTTSRCYH